MQVWVKVDPEVVEEFKSVVVKKKGDFSRNVNAALKLYLSAVKKQLVVVKSRDGYELTSIDEIDINDVFSFEILPVGPSFHENVIEPFLDKIIPRTTKITVRSVERERISEEGVDIDVDLKKLVEIVKSGHSLVLKLDTGVIVVSGLRICGFSSP